MKGIVRKMLVNGFEFSDNFWELNPQLKIGVFKNLYDNDKDKKKSYSSKIMILVANVADTESKLSNIPQEDVIPLVVEDILGEQKDFYNKNKLTIESCIDYYRKIQESPADRQLRIWNQKMDEKTKFMEKTPYDADNWDMLDKMMKSNVDSYKALTQIVEQLSKEGDGTAIRGGAEQSLSDKGLI